MSAFSIRIRACNGKWKPCISESQGYLHQEIAALLRVSGSTVTHYFRDYQTGGIDQLKELTLGASHFCDEYLYSST